jgi:50S ribosomal subunit-associated GTPase HflX
MHKNTAYQCHTVEEILKGLNLGDKPRIMVFNKLDLALGSEEELEHLTTVPFLREQIASSNENIALISAAKGWGINNLLEKITSYLNNALMHDMVTKSK